MDVVDFAATAVLGLAAVFVIAFSWNASAGAARSELSLRTQLEAEARRRVGKEREQIGHLLALADDGEKDQARQLAEKSADRFAGNSQFHLLRARLGLAGGEMGPVLGAYRRALELNRDYSDRRSEFYLGGELRPLLREARLAYLGEGAAGGKGPLRDLFFIERALAGGCH